MQNFLMAFFAGGLQSGMQSLNGELQSYIGLFGVSLVTHLIGGVLLAGYLVIRGERIRLGPMPWYLYSAGALGLILVAGSSFCVARIGPALTTCMSIGGQLFFSTLMDHFGWMGVKRTPFQAKRLPSLFVVLIGVLVVNAGAVRTGGRWDGGCLLLGFLLGGVNVLSKTVNFRATGYLGTANGTLINYIVASPLSAVLMVLAGEMKGGWTGFGSAPLWLYLGGVCGVVALVLNVTSLRGLTLFQSAALLLMGQLTGAAVMDAVMYQNMSLIKLAGILVVTTGVVWDKKTALLQ